MNPGNVCWFQVVAIKDLVDTNFVQQSEPGYSNVNIMLGDQLLSIGGELCENANMQHVCALLSGPAGSLVEMTLARKQGFRLYTVRVMRHRRHEHLDNFEGVLKRMPDGDQNDTSQAPSRAVSISNSPSAAVVNAIAQSASARPPISPQVSVGGRGKSPAPNRKLAVSNGNALAAAENEKIALGAPALPARKRESSHRPSCFNSNLFGKTRKGARAISSDTDSQSDNENMLDAADGNAATASLHTAPRPIKIAGSLPAPHRWQEMLDDGRQNAANSPTVSRCRSARASRQSSARPFQMDPLLEQWLGLHKFETFPPLIRTP